MVLFSALLLLGCTGGDSGPSQREKDLSAQLLSASTQLAQMNSSLSQATAERDALQATVTQLQQDKASLTIQVDQLKVSTQNVSSSATDQTEKITFVKGKMAAVSEKLGLYDAYDMAFVQTSSPSNSQLVDIGIKVRALNDTAIQNNWNALLDCGYCANATNLKVLFYTSILTSVKTDVDAAKAKLG